MSEKPSVSCDAARAAVRSIDGYDFVTELLYRFIDQAEAPTKELLAQSEQIHALRSENARLRAACEAALSQRWATLPEPVIQQLREALGRTT